jgi:O-antigen/teichoic acid export membrane protein
MSGVGIYTTALRLSSIGGMFHYSLQRIAIPMISDLHSQGKLDQLRRVYQTITKWGMTFNLPIFLTIAIFAEPLLYIFGADFVAGAPGLVILAFATLFNASTGVCGSVITMTGHSKLTLVNSIIYLVTNMALDVLFIPRWGVVGAALAVTLTSVLINTLRTVEVFVLLRLWPYDRSFLKPVTAALIAAGAAYLINQWFTLRPLMLQAIVGTLVLWSIYALVIISLKLSKEDWLVLERLWARFKS